MTLENKVAVILGASSGIGEGIAYAIAEQKPRGLVLAARRKEMLDAIAEKAGGNTLVVPTDVTKYEDLQNLFKQTIHTYGHIDYVINSAGIIQKETPVEDFTPEEFRRVIEMNLNQAYDVAHMITPKFKQQGNGIYLVISSQAGEIAFPGEAAYNASKAGVNHMIRSIDLEWKDYRDNEQPLYAFAVGPGFINTEEARRQFPDVPQKTWDEAPTPLEFGRTIVEYVTDPEGKFLDGGAVHTLTTV